MHSARWDQSYDFNGTRMAIIGVGSTAVQIVPQLQKVVTNMKCFIRSPAWITPSYAEQHAGPDGSNFDYTDEQKVRMTLTWLTAGRVRRGPSRMARVPQGH